MFLMVLPPTRLSTAAASSSPVWASVILPSKAASPTKLGLPVKTVLISETSRSWGT